MFLLGLNLNPFNRVLYALQKFEGVGLATSQRLLAQSSIHQFCRISELSERQVIKLKGLLQPMMEAQKQEKLMKLKAAKSIPRPILPS
jgi:ribosomal protein S13